MEGEAVLSFKRLLDAVASDKPGEMMRRVSVFTQRYPSFPAVMVGCDDEDLRKIGFLMRSYTREEMFMPGNERFIKLLWRCAEKHGAEFEMALRLFCAKRLYGCFAVCVVQHPSGRTSTLPLCEEGVGLEGAERAIHFIETEETPGSPFADERVMAMLVEVRTLLLSPGHIPAQIAEVTRWPAVKDVCHSHQPHDRIFHRKGQGCIQILEDGSVAPLADMSCGVVTARMKCRDDEQVTDEPRGK